MKVIETVFDGYKFRSRLEARWAVFFSVLREPYEYEPEGFELGDAGLYLPDFYIPRSDLWLEIKPATYGKDGGVEWPTDQEVRKAAAFSVEHRIYIVCGSCDTPNWCEDRKYDAFPVGEHGVCDEGYYAVRCPLCKLFGFEFQGRAARLPCECENDYKKYGKEGRSWGLGGDGLLCTAMTRAKQARFEHGQRPEGR